MHINVFLWRTINKAITRPSHAHMCSDQGSSSVFVIWTKQVCLQTRLQWWQWCGTPDIIWNRVPDRRRSKRKMSHHQVLPYCAQVYWEEAWCMRRNECSRCVMAFSEACQRHMMALYRCAVVAYTSYFVWLLMITDKWCQSRERVIFIINFINTSYIYKYIYIWFLFRALDMK